MDPNENNNLSSSRNKRWIEQNQPRQRWNCAREKVGMMLTRSNSRKLRKNFESYRSNSKSRLIEKKKNILKNVMKMFPLKTIFDSESERMSGVTESSTFSNTSSEEHIKYDKMVSGLYPPKVETRILSKMTGIALNHANKGSFMVSYRILNQVLEVKKSSLGLDHNEVAYTLYHIGNVLQMSGVFEDALSVYLEGFKILFPKRSNEKNINLASILYQMGFIEFKNQNFDVSAYYLGLSKQVETHILGTPNVETLKLIDDVDAARKQCDKSLRELRPDANIYMLESSKDADAPRDHYDDPIREARGSNDLNMLEFDILELELENEVIDDDYYYQDTIKNF